MTIKKEDLDRCEVLLFEGKPYLVNSGQYLEIRTGRIPTTPEFYAVKEHWMAEEAAKSRIQTQPYEVLRPFLGLLATTGKREIDGERVKDSNLLTKIAKAIIDGQL